MSNYNKIFSRSLTRCVTTDSDRFFSHFYDRFVPSSPAIEAMFIDVDMVRQRRILEASLAYMSEFAAFLTKTDQLERLAERHSRREIDIAPALYEVWLDILVETVEELDPEYTDEVGLAWRVVMSPGIAFMKAHY
jgi:hemoglobin-like flavoprotein